MGAGLAQGGRMIVRVTGQGPDWYVTLKKTLKGYRGMHKNKKSITCDFCRIILIFNLRL